MNELIDSILLYGSIACFVLCALSNSILTDERMSELSGQVNEKITELETVVANEKAQRIALQDALQSQIDELRASQANGATPEELAAIIERLETVKSATSDIVPDAPPVDEEPPADEIPSDEG